MILRAPGVTLMPLTVTGLSSVPEAITFTRSARLLTSPEVLSAARSAVLPAKLSSSCTRSSSVRPFDCDTKPTFGRRRCSGIWPPSNPTL